MGDSTVQMAYWEGKWSPKKGWINEWNQSWRNPSFKSFGLMSWFNMLHFGWVVGYVDFSDEAASLHMNTYERCVWDPHGMHWSFTRSFPCYLWDLASVLHSHRMNCCWGTGVSSKMNNMSRREWETICTRSLTPRNHTKRRANRAENQN